MYRSLPKRQYKGFSIIKAAPWEDNGKTFNLWLRCIDAVPRTDAPLKYQFIWWWREHIVGFTSTSFTKNPPGDALVDISYHKTNMVIFAIICFIGFVIVDIMVLK